MCSACRKKGHISSVCRSRCQRSQPAAVTGEAKYVSEQLDAGKEQQEWSVLTLNHQTTPPIQVTVQLSRNPVTMEVDTWGIKSLMLIQQWSNLGVLATLEPCPLQTAYMHRGNSGCAWACAGRSTVSTAKKVATLVDSGGIRADIAWAQLARTDQIRLA